METHKIDSQLLSAIRFPLIILVVFIHSLPNSLTDINLSDIDLYIIVSETISHIIGRIAVPSFFLISGYLFFFKTIRFDVVDYIDKLKKRLKTIVIPFFLWTVLFIVAIIVKNYLFLKLNLPKDDYLDRIYVANIPQLFWKEPINYPLWYLRDLICMVLISPFFFLLFKYTKLFGVLLLYIPYIFNMEFGIPGFSMTAIFFFGSGSFLGINKINFSEYLKNEKNIFHFISFVLIIAAISLHNSNYEEYIIRLFVPFGMISFFCLIKKLLKKEQIGKRLNALSSTVFFIYGLHAIYLMNWRNSIFEKLTSTLPNPYGLWSLLLYLLTPVAIISICLFFYYISLKILPKTLRILNGGR